MLVFAAVCLLAFASQVSGRQSSVQLMVSTKEAEDGNNTEATCGAQIAEYRECVRNASAAFRDVMDGRPRVNKTEIMEEIADCFETAGCENPFELMKRYQGGRDDSDEDEEGEEEGKDSHEGRPRKGSGNKSKGGKHKGWSKKNKNKRHKRSNKNNKMADTRKCMQEAVGDAMDSINITSCMQEKIPGWVSPEEPEEEEDEDDDPPRMHRSHGLKSGRGPGGCGNHHRKMFRLVKAVYNPWVCNSTAASQAVRQCLINGTRDKLEDMAEKNPMEQAFEMYDAKREFHQNLEDCKANLSSECSDAMKKEGKYMRKCIAKEFRKKENKSLKKDLQKDLRKCMKESGLHNKIVRKMYLQAMRQLKKPKMPKNNRQEKGKIGNGFSSNETPESEPMPPPGLGHPNGPKGNGKAARKFREKMKEIREKYKKKFGKN